MSSDDRVAMPGGALPVTGLTRSRSTFSTDMP